MENKSENNEEIFKRGPTSEKKCIRCNSYLNAYERQFLGGLCASCAAYLEKIEKE